MFHVILNFNSFTICLNNLDLSINSTYEKEKVTRDEKRNLVQVFNSLDVNVILNRKKEITTDMYYKNTKTCGYLPYDSAHLESCMKS